MSDSDMLYDVLIVSQRRDSKVPDGAAAAVLRYMAASRYIRPVNEAVAQDWVEVYCAPDAASHQCFITGTAEGSEPVFKEAVFRWGTVPVALPYGGAADESIYWFIELRGCRYDYVLGDIKNRIKDVAYIRPVVYVRSHEEAPPHREVPPGEERKDLRLKRGAGVGLAGTRVEEF